MVLVENALGTFQIEVVLGVFSPWQVDHRLEIVQLNVEVRTLRIQVVEFGNLFLEGLGNLFRPLLLSGFL